MIAIANNIREVIEIRKFATSQESVLSVDYDRTQFPGKHITKAEAKKHNLKMDDHDDL